MMRKNIRSGMIVAVLCLPAFGLAQTKMKVMMGAQQIGDAVYTYQFGADGKKTMESRMNVTMFGKEMVISQKVAVNAVGMPLRKSQEIKIKSPRTSLMTIAEYFENGVKLVVDQNGARTPSDYALPAGCSMVDPSEFWFFRDRPTVGQKVESYTLNLESKVWEKNEVTYEGKITVKIGAKSFAGHKITSMKAGAKSTIVVDEKGQPIQMDGPMGFRMERAL